MHSPDSLPFDAGALTRTAPPRFDVRSATQWLRSDIDWPAGVRLEGARMSRLWVGLPGRVWFELQLDIVRDGRPEAFELQGAYIHRTRRWHIHRTPVFTEHGLMGLSIVNEPLGVWCCTPDRDRKFRVVRELLDADGLPRFLAQTRAAPLLGLDRGAAEVKAEIVAYRASKRCVMRVSSVVDGEPRAVFVKTFKRAQTSDEVDALERLGADLQARSEGAIRVPRVIDNLAEQRLLIVAAVPLPSARLRTSSEDLADAANLLAHLHRADLQVSRVHTVANEFELACRRVRELMILGAPHQPLLALLGRIARCGGSVDDDYDTIIHGAFHTGQVLRSGGRLWLLDLDTLAHGHCEADLGKFVARLLYSRYDDEARAAASRAAARVLREEYRARGGRIREDRMRFYLPCAMSRHGAAALAKGHSVEHVSDYWRLGEEYATGARSLL